MRRAAFSCLVILAVPLWEVGPVLFSPVLFGERAYAAGFLDAVDDMPLMAGLTETGEGVAFDKPDGRIIRAVATGGVTVDAVRRFYLETLPQLGWSRVQSGDQNDKARLVFVREQERLEIQLESPNQKTLEGAATLVRFSIEPN